MTMTCTLAVLQELSLVVSVGIGNNKMVAKLASQASKPNGILTIDGDAALQKLLSTTPASRLPRCGGKVTDTLTMAGVHTVADLQVPCKGTLALTSCRYGLSETGGYARQAFLIKHAQQAILTIADVPHAASVKFSWAV